MRVEVVGSYPSIYVGQGRGMDWWTSGQCTRGEGAAASSSSSSSLLSWPQSRLENIVTGAPGQNAAVTPAGFGGDAADARI